MIDISCSFHFVSHFPVATPWVSKRHVVVILTIFPVEEFFFLLWSNLLRSLVENVPNYEMKFVGCAKNSGHFFFGH